jgi:hypothetical protein
MTSTAASRSSSAALAALPRDPRGDLLKTLDEQKKALTEVGVAAGAVDRIAQNLFDAEKKKHEDALDLWKAAEDRLRKEREAAREKQLEEELAKDDALREKALRRKTPEAPRALDTTLSVEEIFHIPPTVLDNLKLVTHAYFPLAHFLYENMNTYRDTARSAAVVNAIVPVYDDDDGTMRWVPQSEASGLKMMGQRSHRKKYPKPRILILDSQSSSR